MESQFDFFLLYFSPRKCFFDFNLLAVSAHFWPQYFFNLTDGWMGDGWWVMGDGWVGPKNVLRFRSKFFRWSSGDINVRKFGTSAKKFLYRKKIQLQFSKIGGFLVEKKVLRFCSKFFQMKFRWYKCAEIWKICEKLFLSGKKSNFNFQKVGVFLSKKRFSDFSQI